LPEQLRRLIADRVGVGEEQVVLGSGASGVAMQVLHAVTRPGDRIVMSQPTFDGYPIFAQMARLTPVTVGLNKYGHHDLPAMAEAATDAKVVVLCRPHNPTGTLEPLDAVEWFLQEIPRDAIVLLDEAYIEFVAARYRIDGPDLIRRFPNVVVLRTFSKAYGLAGLRIGYGFAAPELASTLWTMQLPFGMSNVSAVAVAASFDAEAQLAQRIRRITAERNHLRLRLMAMGIYSTDSHANFVYLPPARQPWREVFAEGGLEVRCYPDGGARITVGDLPSTLAVLSAIEKSQA
jgi:histidinol-phosphate aminotransferase